MKIWYEWEVTLSGIWILLYLKVYYVFKTYYQNWSDFRAFFVQQTREKSHRKTCFFYVFFPKCYSFFCRVYALGTIFNVQKLASFFLELSRKIFHNDVSFYSFLCTFPRKTPFSMFNNKIEENRRVYYARKIGTSNTCRYKSFDSRETLNKMLWFCCTE